MICSRCSLGAALLVEAKEDLNRLDLDGSIHPLIRIDSYDTSYAISRIHVMQDLGRYFHSVCKGCDCQHHTNVREGIDWSKVKGQGNFQHDVQGVTVNGINQNDEKAAREV